MHIIKIFILFIFSSLSMAEELEYHPDYLGCSGIVTLEHKTINESEVGAKVSIEAAVTQLISNELNILNQELQMLEQRTWSTDPSRNDFLGILLDFSNKFSDPAKCLGSLYREGDQVFSYLLDTNITYQTGFVLIREGKVLTIVFTEFIIV